MKIITRLLTKNLTKVPLLWITFNMQKYKKYGKKNSCTQQKGKHNRSPDKIIYFCHKLCKIHKVYLLHLLTIYTFRRNKLKNIISKSEFWLKKTSAALCDGDHHVPEYLVSECISFWCIFYIINGLWLSTKKLMNTKNILFDYCIQCFI